MKIEKGTENTILRQVATEITEITEDIRLLAEKMQKVMHAEKGIGLAAPQIGHSIRLIVATIEGHDLFLINPEIKSFSAECKEDEEGCLSLPGDFFLVSRAKKIAVEFLDLDGKKHLLHLRDLDARVIQHEIDHLNGILFVDRVENEKNENILVA